MMLEDLQLLHRMRRGDQHGATELWCRWSPRLVALARMTGGGTCGAEDVVQRVFLRLVGLDAASAGGIVDLGAFLVTMVRNEVRNVARGTQRAERLDASAARGRTEVAGATPEAGDELQAAIDALPTEQRELLRLKHVAELTFAQIGLVLEVNHNTVASRYRSALDALRTLLQSGSQGDRALSCVKLVEVNRD